MSVCENTKVIWAGVLASGLSIFSLTFFTYNIINTKITGGIHYGWVMCRILIAFLWIIYAYYNKITPSIVSSGVSIFAYLIIILFKYNNELNKEKVNDEEEEEEEEEEEVMGLGEKINYVEYMKSY